LPDVDSALRDSYEMHALPPAGPARDALLAEHGARFVGAVTSARFGVEEALLTRLPNVRVISSFGVGLDKFDLPAATRRGIVVGYTPDVMNDCVADTAFALVLAAGRRIAEGDRYVRAGKWTQQPTPPFPLGRQVSGARLGIVGLGRIGRTIARRASGFDMDVRYHNRRAVADAPWRFEASLHELARWCDFLVVSTAGGEETRHLIDASVLEALGAKGFVVNIARGTVIDEQALVRALQDRRIAGAGLDVFEHEPQVPAEMLELDNVVLLPHIASATVQTRQAMGQRVLTNLADFFAGRPLTNAANG
jgi:lactate dehydrogenase-like 2-hydroxyacid dehydrogenase